MNRRRPLPIEQPRPYWWWKGASVEELTRRLVAAGPDARLEVHIDAEQHATLVVLPAGAERASLPQAINESFVCPPRC
jgi:transcription initiation factor IIE alpha subunit